MNLFNLRPNYDYIPYDIVKVTLNRSLLLHVFCEFFCQLLSDCHEIWQALFSSLGNYQ